MRPRSADTARRAGFSRRGFSFIELITVIAILGLLLAGATMATGSITSGRSRIAARTVFRDLLFARDRAMATGSRIWVVFSTSTDSYTMLAENPASPGRAGATALTDPATGGALLRSLSESPMHADLTSAAIASGSEVGFDRLGRPTDASGSLLTSTASIVVSGHTITIEPETGAISLP